MAVALKNTARGARGVRTQDGELIMVEPGQTVSGDFADSEVKDALAGDFEKGKASDVAEEPEQERREDGALPGDPPVPEDKPENEVEAPAPASNRRQRG